MKVALTLLPFVAVASPIFGQQLSFEAIQPDPAAVRIMDIYARCAVADDPERAARIVGADYRTGAYRKAIRAFAMSERSCVPRAGKLKFQPVVFAGMMAEDLMRRRHVDVSALDRMAAPSSPNGPIACVVRTQPGQIAELFRTVPASSREAQAVARLQGPVADCLPPGQAPVTNNVILRAELALVSYRLATLSGVL